MLQIAAGVLSPVATLVLVAVTPAGALPVHRLVARESPHGEGSIAMLERLLPGGEERSSSCVLIGHNVGVTLVLLGGVFLVGFREAIGIAVVLVATYLALTSSSCWSPSATSLPTPGW